MYLSAQLGPLSSSCTPSSSSSITEKMDALIVLGLLETGICFDTVGMLTGVALAGRTGGGVGACNGAETGGASARGISAGAGMGAGAGAGRAAGAGGGAVATD